MLANTSVCTFQHDTCSRCVPGLPSVVYLRDQVRLDPSPTTLYLAGCLAVVLLLLQLLLPVRRQLPVVPANHEVPAPVEHAGREHRTHLQLGRLQSRRCSGQSVSQPIRRTHS